MSRERVIVVGAGLAGLAAAQELHSGGFNVLVLEADCVLGGRVKQLSGLVPWPVEIGAEFLHGIQHSSTKLIADKLGCELKELPYPDCYYIGKERRFLNSEEAEDHPDIVTVHELFADLATQSPPSPDISMLDFLKNKLVNDTVLQLSQSIYSNDFGCSLNELGVGECIEEAKQWIYGDAYMVLDRPLSCIINQLSKGLKVLLNHPVEEILYSSGSKVQLKCKGGANFEADKVVLTVPVKVLEKQMIKFDPPLPRMKIEAASTIRMSNAMKILLAFSSRFWPEEMFDVVCTDCFIPEVWTTHYPSSETTTTAAVGKFLLVGFVAGEAAVATANLQPDEIFSRTLSQLDEMFGKPTSENQNRSIRKTSVVENLTIRNGLYVRDRSRMSDCCEMNQPASFFFEGGVLVDWSKQEFIRGGYTHPSLNAQGARQALALPVAQKLFFAGEATHPGVNPCMHAAIDTGIRAAKEIFQLDTL